MARRHDVQFTGPDHHVAAHAVAVPDVPGQRPGHRLQPDVRVRQHGHRRPVRAEAVQEAPGADGGQAALGEGPPDVHGAHPAERHFPLRPQLQARAGRTLRGGRRDRLPAAAILPSWSPSHFRAVACCRAAAVSHPNRIRLRMVTVGIPLSGSVPQTAVRRAGLGYRNYQRADDHVTSLSVASEQNR